MRVLAAVALLLAATSIAAAQPGMTQPYGQPTYAPPPPPAGAPAPQPYYGGGYQPQWAQPQPQLDLQLKSSGTALLWAIGTTVAGIATIGAAFDEESEGLLLLGAGLTLVGPSAGHIYAGEGSHAVKASLLRAGGVVVFTLGAIENGNYECYDAYYCEDDDDGETAMWIGGLVVVASTLYDFYDAGRAVNRYNDRRRKAAYQVAPTMMSKAGGGFTPGVGVSGSF